MEGSPFGMGYSRERIRLVILDGSSNNFAYIPLCFITRHNAYNLSIRGCWTVSINYPLSAHDSMTKQQERESGDNHLESEISCYLDPSRTLQKFKVLRANGIGQLQPPNGQFKAKRDGSLWSVPPDNDHSSEGLTFLMFVHLLQQDLEEITQVLALGQRESTASA